MNTQLPSTRRERSEEPPHQCVENNLGWALIRDAVREHPQRPAIRQGDLVLSYRDLDERTSRTMAALQRAGVASGDRVALLFPNDHRYLECLFATMRLGAVAVPLNSRSSRSAMAHVLTDAAPAALVAHETAAAEATALLNEAGITSVLLITAERDDWILEHGDLAEPIDGAELPLVPIVPVEPDAVCMQPYTSGSTGRPKGCELTHGGQLWNARVTRDAWKITVDDCGLAAAPLYHKNAMICVVKPCLLAGATIALASDPSPAAIPAEVERNRCTYTTGVPATYEILLHSHTYQEHDMSSLRFVVCGSAPLTEESARRITDALQAPVLECYGLTEGGPMVLISTFDAWRRGSPGRPVTGCEVRVVADDGSDSAVGSAGELWVRSPGVIRGYAGLPEITRARVSEDGWLRTGDLARRDNAGYYYILGRSDEMMIVGGENLYPLEVEQLIAALPGVAQVAVVPASDPLKGQVPVAFVVADDDLSEVDILRHCLVNGAPYAHPRQIVRMDDQLPVNGTGKIDKLALTTLAEQSYQRRQP
ncbi:class I adenylate-forming enzyme family protein [Streptomyces sp. 3N207]|uniref:class I adenylate-forming enzyme family protein n=1 Tax=Streptomyces sp. 3N207 TaxID=3457417 RepID=UPI003FD5AC0E